MRSEITPDKVFSTTERERFLRVITKARAQALERLALTEKAGHKPTLQDFSIVRDSFLFDLMLHTGLRISEALALQFHDIRPDHIIVQAANSKNRKLGTLYYGDHCKRLLSELREFLDKYRKVQSFLLFSRNRKRSSRSHMHNRFKYWLAVARLPSHYSLHCLRHTYATYLLDKGIPLPGVRDQLRHSDISITSKYLHVTQETRNRLKEIT